MSDEVARFSEIGDRYGEQLSRGLALSGENAEFFARRRVGRLREIVAERGLAAGTVLDFGCGTGGTFAALREAFPAARLLGFEPAEGARRLAVAAATASGAEVLDDDALGLERAVDVVYCNGVFHHVPVEERATAMRALAGVVRVAGVVCVWENSPYNPGARWLMSRIPFDRDARLLTPRALRTLLASAGLAVMRTEYHFVFPRALSLCRPLEPHLRAMPLGAQYVVIGERRG